jgi:hypothetical protein
MNSKMLQSAKDSFRFGQISRLCLCIAAVSLHYWSLLCPFIPPFISIESRNNQNKLNLLVKLLIWQDRFSLYIRRSVFILCSILAIGGLFIIRVFYTINYLLILQSFGYFSYKITLLFNLHLISFSQN